VPSSNRSVRSRLVWLFGVAASLAGCVAYAPSLKPDAAPAAGRAYLYGRFFMTSDSQPLAMDGYATMGFKLSCDNGKSYTIRFRKNPHVQVIDIAPGTCAMTEIVFSDADGGIKGRRAPPPGYRTPRVFTEGSAYYLGDYDATSTHEWKVFVTELRWEITSEENDYAGATQELFGIYRAFSGIPTADRSFVSAVPKGRPRRRPDDVPSPSPKQVAAVAPLIDRTFPTMQACEAACAKGDCMAFRGADGDAAMTCITYCSSDGGCEDGFTCSGTGAPLTGVCVRRAGNEAAAAVP